MSSNWSGSPPLDSVHDGRSWEHQQLYHQPFGTALCRDMFFFSMWFSHLDLYKTDITTMAMISSYLYLFIYSFIYLMQLFNCAAPKLQCLLVVIGANGKLVLFTKQS